jgi:hypothetical protein
MLAALLLATRILFDNTWQTAPSDGVDLKLTPEGGVMRLDFDFHGHGGWAAIRKPVDITLPPNYRFHFRTRGETPANTLEFKLVDPSGENVWWYRKPGWEWPREWTDVNIDKRKIEFAWGPSPTRVATKIAFIEITVTAVKGGKGTVWLDDLTFDEIGAESGMPVATASSTANAQTPDLALDSKGDTGWRPASGGEQWLAVDFKQIRELGGLIVDWAPNEHASSYSVETSADGAAWTSVREVRGGNGGRDYLQTPGVATRFLRLHLREGTAYAIREIAFQPPDFGDSSIGMYQLIARDALRGHFPRQLRNEFAYWTVFGINGDEGIKPLLSEDGAIETPRGFTIEPFLRVDGRLISWADVTTSQALEQRVLPMPSTTWHHPQFNFDVSTHGLVSARYRYRNTSTRTEDVELFLAVRPLRVTPPWHVLNIPELTAPIRSIAWSDPELVVDGYRIKTLQRPQRVVTSTFDGGDASELFDAPARAGVEDPQRHASALLVYRFKVPAGERREVELVSGPGQSREDAVAGWSAVASHVKIDIPAARDFVDSVKANIGYMLVTRDGPAIRGGPRNYDRSWIRDGSLSSSVLLRFGFRKEVADYIRWFAPFQFADGKVPCCVDDRGADPVAENDSHGEFIYLVASYARLTGDLTVPRDVWPNVLAAAKYIDSLRRQRMTEKYRGTQFYGLLPESISHEGYSAKPMHSYWDDFFALRGLKDVVWLAEKLGHATEAKQLAAIRDEFDRDLHASIRKSIAVHNINYIPGAADIGDFDPTSTTIALEPGLDQSSLPKDALEGEYTRYWNESEARMTGAVPWTLYTPYEVRNVGVMVRLGWRERAFRLLNWFMQDRRPLGWLSWGEVVAREYRDPKYLGDIPHTWVGSDYVRSFLNLLFYEREDGALVIGAGVPPEWIDRGIHVRGVHTMWGPLTLDITKDGARASVSDVPPGGIVFKLPGKAEKKVTGVRIGQYSR